MATIYIERNGEELEIEVCANVTPSEFYPGEYEVDLTFTGNETLTSEEEETATQAVIREYEEGREYARCARRASALGIEDF